MASVFRRRRRRAIGPTKSWPRFASCTCDNSDPAAGTCRSNCRDWSWESNDARPNAASKSTSPPRSRTRTAGCRQKALAAVAAERQLNAKYLAALWKMLSGYRAIATARCTFARSWRGGSRRTPRPSPTEIAQWQSALTQFQSVGHMKSWMVAGQPGLARSARASRQARAAGRGRRGHAVSRGRRGRRRRADDLARLAAAAAGRAGTARSAAARRARVYRRTNVRPRRTLMFAATAKSLPRSTRPCHSAEQSIRGPTRGNHDVDVEALSAWLDYFGVRTSRGGQARPLRASGSAKASGYDFVKGWGKPETPSLMANSSDKHVRDSGQHEAARRRACIPRPLCRPPSAGKAR